MKKNKTNARLIGLNACRVELLKQATVRNLTPDESAKLAKLNEAMRPHISAIRMKNLRKPPRIRRITVNESGLKLRPVPFSPEPKPTAEELRKIVI